MLLGGDGSTKPSSSVDDSTSIRLISSHPFVGRGGDKLAEALDHFGTSPRELTVLDVGSSVGGFTDCLLRRGATAVVAVDVGRGQLSEELRRHPAVHSLEGTDIRSLDLGTLGGPFDLVVVDLSFISLCETANTLASAVKTGGDLIALIKPQFEVGRDRIGRGVVSAPDLRAEAVTKVKKCLADAGLDSVDVMPSTIKGEHGNQEYFLRASRSRGKPRSGRTGVS